MQTISYTLPPTDDYPYFITANCYSSKRWEEQSKIDAPSLTLIVLHSTSFHKEIWEPTLAHFIQFCDQSVDTSVSGDKTGKRDRKPVLSVRDIWAIECPNHGASAQLNLRGRNGSQITSFSCAKYAQVVHHFLTVAPHHPNGPKVDFRRRTLVGVGHSLGANAILLLQNEQPSFHFSHLVIVEPMVTAIGMHHLDPLRNALIARAKTRKNVWKTQDDARQSLSKRGWDPAVVDVFIKHGMYWAPEKNGYTLHCTREQEIGMYEDIDGPTTPVEALDEICRRTPVHLILGERPDFIPSHVHQALFAPSSNRRFASITELENTGHLIPQEQPFELAGCMFKALSCAGLPPPRL